MLKRLVEPIENDRFHTEQYERSFNIDSQNRTVFYPWGKLGKGYILASESQKSDWRPYFVKANMTLFLLSVGSLIIAGLLDNLAIFYVGFAMAFLVFIKDQWRLRNLYKNLSISAENFKPETFESFLQKKSIPFLFFGFTLMTFVSIGMLYLSYLKISNLYIFAFGICISGLIAYGAYRYARKILVRLKISI